MDLELHPSIILQDRAWHILVAPLPMLTAALNRNLELQRFEVLYICGNYSRVLSSLDRRFTTLQVRRAFTVFQLTELAIVAGASGLMGAGFARRDDVMLGVGLGLVVQSLLFLVLDEVASRRADTYVTALDDFLP